MSDFLRGVHIGIAIIGVTFCVIQLALTLSVFAPKVPRWVINMVESPRYFWFYIIGFGCIILTIWGLPFRR